MKLKPSYKPLWKLLIDRGLKRSELRRLTGLSSATIAKLSKDESVTISVIIRICEALDCQPSDIVAAVKDCIDKEECHG